MALIPLGAIPATGKIATWLLERLAFPMTAQLAEMAKPHIERFIQDPGGSIGRMGDLLVWHGEKGNHVIATLESLTENQERVKAVVAHIETAQIGIAGSLGTLTSLSMATLGITSLAAGFMIWRMKALHARLAEIGSQISDIQAHIDAHDKAFLQTGLDFMANFEHSGKDHDRHTALEQSTFATNLYRNLVESEIGEKRRLIVLNQCGRYYLLALMAQIRCLVLAKDALNIADQRLVDHKPTLINLGRVMFDAVMGKSPEMYLHPNMSTDHVTLDLLTEIYQHAHKLGAVSGAEFRDAGQVFEHLRSKIYDVGRGLTPVGMGKTNLINKLKYLMACLEELSRIESLRLRINEARTGKLSFQDLEETLAASRDQKRSPGDNESQESVMAFALI